MSELRSWCSAVAAGVSVLQAECVSGCDKEGRMSIQAGDLVMVVRGHSCVLNKYGGIPMTVESVHASSSGIAGFRCFACTQLIAPEGYAEFLMLSIPLSWLKKINPLAEPERVERDEEVTA